MTPRAKDHGPQVESALEATLPAVQLLHNGIDDDRKLEVGHVEDINNVKEAEAEDDPNSPEAILNRYPLLKSKSEKELDILNRQLRRRIDVRMLPILTICLMINYLDRSNVTNAR